MLKKVKTHHVLIAIAVIAVAYLVYKHYTASKAGSSADHSTFM